MENTSWNAWNRKIDQIAAAYVHLNRRDAWALAYALVGYLLEHVVPDTEVYREGMEAVKDVYRRCVPETWENKDLRWERHYEAGLLSSRLFHLGGPKVAWSRGYSVPWECADTLRMSLDQDIHDRLPVIMACVERLRDMLGLPPEAYAEIVAQYAPKTPPCVSVTKEAA